jgi:RimJ/RimL family protein N-acetyltransferase
MYLRPDYPVSTERLTLQPLTAADVDDVLIYRSRADVCRYLPFEPMTRDVLSARIASDLGQTEISEPGQAITFGVRVGGSRPVIGDVVLIFESREHAAGELGYAFNPDAGGHGYGTEACAAVLSLAFQQLGLHRMVARIDARNGRSAALAARLGMRREAHFVESRMFRGEWSNELVYAMLATEWTARPG